MVGQRLPAGRTGAPAPAPAVNARLRERMRVAIIDVGADLRQIKERLPHGEFGKWLHAEFNMTERTAQNYMAAAALVEKYETVSVLRPKTLYLLAAPSTPSDAREKLIKRFTCGEMLSDRAVRDEISEARRRERLDELQRHSSKRRQRVSAEARKKQEAARLKLEATRAKQREATEKIVALLVEVIADRRGELAALLKLDPSAFELVDGLARAIAAQEK